MKYNLKLNHDEEEFAAKHITDYYSDNAKCKYSDLIGSILRNFENNIIDYGLLKTDDGLKKHDY